MSDGHTEFQKQSDAAGARDQRDQTYENKIAELTAELAAIKGALEWRSGTPDIPEGGQRPFLCSVSGGRAVVILLYSNRFVGPASDDTVADDETETSPDSGEYYWTGWFEEACSQCDTFWRWDKPVDGWMPLAAALNPSAP